jgi:hypothetical protein
MEFIRRLFGGQIFTEDKNPVNPARCDACDIVASRRVILSNFYFCAISPDVSGLSFLAADYTEGLVGQGFSFAI